jgi:hypothetical protein
LKIAQITPLYEAVPPKLYGGTERVVAWLSDALVDAGHEVTLFASADAETKAALVPVRDQAIRLDPAELKSDLAAHMTMLQEVRARMSEFDVLHFHVDMIHFPFFEECAERTLTTLHGRLDLKDLPGVYRRWRQFPARLDLDGPAQAAAQRELAGLRAPRHARFAVPLHRTPARAITSPSSAASRRRKRVDRAIAIARRVGCR